MSYSIKMHVLPGCHYSSNTLYRTAENKAKMNSIVKSAKENVCYHTIEVDGPSVHVRYIKSGRNWRKM